ncbi:MAG TPA: hypothetical protein VHY22_12785 [Chthoniobacteraceae bacterium]|jgi:hypothetical protein|nr:hypothetical protein [Chthoniobacteraceae bacterium]
MSNRRNSRGRRSELRAAGLRSQRQSRPRTIPVVWLNTVIAFFLLPPAWISTEAFFTCFRHAAVHHQFWLSEECWFFSLGALLWIIAFFGLPRPLVIYVFGHELTHAIWVWIMGGRVSAFRVSSEGGHIISDKHNFWIALAPYFFPLYSILVIAVWGACSFHWSLEPYHRWLYALIGVTWAFHVSFTLWMIPKGQTDLTYYGTFFSLVIIYLMNLAVLTLLLIVATPHVTWRAFGLEWLRHAHLFAQWAVIAAQRLSELTRRFF